jgi:hypothetical protein
MAPLQVRRLIDLAKFLSKQGRYQEAWENFARAEAIALEMKSSCTHAPMRTSSILKLNMLHIIH